jgi:hypothetical protein
MCNALTGYERGIICPPMDGLYNQILHHLDKAFRKLEGMVQPPQKVGKEIALFFDTLRRPFNKRLFRNLHE